MSSVHLLGVIQEYSETNTVSLFNKTVGWKVPKTQFGLQEECLALHSVIMTHLSSSDPEYPVTMKTILNNSVSSKQALDEGLPLDKSSIGTRICFLCLDYFNHNGEFMLHQIGASIMRTNSKKIDTSIISTYSAIVLPNLSAADSFLMSEMGFSRNNMTGKIEYRDLDQMTSREAVSEIQALLGFIEFLSSKHCLDSVLLTYSSTTTLPVLLATLIPL